jgi:hypothetical protein
MKGKVMDIDVITKKIADFESRIASIEATNVPSAIGTPDTGDILANILDRLSAIETAVFPPQPAAAQTTTQSDPSKM